MKKALIPMRHATEDFFIADIFDSIPLKGDIHTMEHPFFALATKPDLRTMRYSRNGVEITLSPHAELGLPTMFDKDILLYCGSLIMAEMKKKPGMYPPQTVRFNCRDLLITTNRHTNDCAYFQIKNAFVRLTGCSITTNIRTPDYNHSAGFHIIDRWKIITKNRDDKRMVKIEVKLSDWLYNALIEKEVLTINKDYFRLRKGLERRLYELARKHCGYQSNWKIGLDNLHEKSGSRSDLRQFRFQMRGIIADNERENHFPDYTFRLDENDIMIFSYKHHKAAPVIASEELEKIQFKFETLEQVRKILAKNAMNTDAKLHSLLKEFAHYIEKKGAPAKIDLAFVGFVRKKMKDAINSEEIAA